MLSQYSNKVLCQRNNLQSFYLSQEALREYLFNADIYKGRKRLSKNELIEMIITDKPQPIKQFDKYEELMNEDAIMQISNN